MTQGKRHQKILHYLESHSELLVEDACTLFEASPATIRRDFNDLTEKGFVQKTWGGIIKLASSDQNNMLPLSYRKGQFVIEKKRIAEKASSLIQDGNSIMIDGGSTTFQMSPLIANMKIRIITNSILVAYEIDKHRKTKQGAEVFLTGGILYPESGLLVGPQVNQNLRNYSVDIAFLSCGGFDELGPTNSNQLVVDNEQTMISQSKKHILMADSNKAESRNMCLICGWEQINIFITDSRFSNIQLENSLNEKNILVHKV